MGGEKPGRFGLRPRSRPSAAWSRRCSWPVSGYRPGPREPSRRLLWKRFGEEVCRSHAGLHGAERMLNRLATHAHGLYVCIKALLHSFEQMLMLPSWNPSLRACRALRFERTFLTGCGPVAPYPLAIFLVRKAIRQLLPSRTAIGVFLRQ